MIIDKIVQNSRFYRRLTKNYKRRADGKSAVSAHNFYRIMLYLPYIMSDILLFLRSYFTKRYATTTPTINKAIPNARSRTLSASTQPV